MADLAANHQVSPEVLTWFESRVTYTGWLGKSHGTFVRANIATAQVTNLSDAQALGLTQKAMSHQCAVVMESDSASLQEQYDQLMALPVRPTVIVYSGGLEPGSLHAYWLFTNPREWTHGDPILDVVKGLAAAYPIVDAKAHPRNPIQWSRGLTGRHMRRCRGQVVEGNEQAAIAGTNQWYSVEDIEAAFPVPETKDVPATAPRSEKKTAPFVSFSSLPPEEQAQRVKDAEEVFARWAQDNPRWLAQDLRNNHPEWHKTIMALTAFVGKAHAKRIAGPRTDDQAIIDAIDGYDPGRITGRSLFFLCGQPSKVRTTKEVKPVPQPVKPEPIDTEGFEEPKPEEKRYADDIEKITDHLRRYTRNFLGKREWIWVWHKNQWRRETDSDHWLHLAWNEWLAMGRASDKFDPAVTKVRKRLLYTNTFWDLTQSGEEMPRHLLPFSDCVLDMRTGEVAPHCPEHHNTWTLSSKYTASQDCPGIMSFLAGRMPDKEDRDLFLAWCWATLTGHHAKVFLELVGESNTGKSTLVRLAKALVGAQNCESTRLSILESPTQKFESASLMGKRLVVFSEEGRYSGSLEVLKSLTGRDDVRAEFKGLNDRPTYTYHGQVVVVGNQETRTGESTDAIKNRRRTIYLDQILDPTDQKEMVEWHDGGYHGALVGEIPAWINWLLAQDAEKWKTILDGVNAANQKRNRLRGMREDPIFEWACESLSYIPARMDVGATTKDLTINYNVWKEQRMPGVSRELVQGRCA